MTIKKEKEEAVEGGEKKKKKIEKMKNRNST